MKRRLMKLELETDYFSIRFTIETESKLRQKILNEAKRLNKKITITKSKSLLVVKLRRQLICSHHDDIIQWCSEVSLLTKDKRILEKIHRIECAATDTKKIGQRMEDRLYEYKTTIESLGFKRLHKTT